LIQEKAEGNYYEKSWKVCSTIRSVLALAAPAVLLSRVPQTALRPWDRTKRGRHPHHRRGFGFEKLNLTDAQKAGMKQVRENHKASLSALREQLQSKHRELRQATNGDSFNEALATQKLAEMAPLEAKLMAERFAMRQEVMNILTPDQRCS
jgi:Spy/CpxP family protein refolding chaperone